MSQVFKPFSSGTPPSNVPTSFLTQDGTATPVSNILLVDSFDSIENNVDGIITRGGINAGPTPDTGTGQVREVSIYLTNRTSVIATTADATPTTVNLMTMTNDTSVTFKVLITILKASATAGTAGGELIGIARATGGVATVVGTNDTFDESDTGAAPLFGFDLTTVDWDVISNGALGLQMQFTGVAATNLNWRFLFEFTQAP